MVIKKLSSHLANQIAAGEVVERPASIVKELLENAVDAKATQIKLNLTEGGLSEIVVIDNGCGISCEDLPLSLAEHATSKISTTEDLNNILSLGFRGEALASIASVSQLVISSKKEQRDAYSYDGAELIPVQMNQGTKVVVQNLFYKIPARKKFLKNANVEFRHISNLFKKFALAYKEIAFSLTHNNRLVYQLPAAKDEKELLGRYNKILGSEFVETSINIDETEEHLHFRVYGRLGLPTFNRATSDMQYIFLNGRLIMDKTINYHVKRAYKDMLYRDRFPAFIIFIEVPTNLVDVNVHPSKYEVRFADNKIFNFLYYAINKNLSLPLQNINTNSGDNLDREAQLNSLKQSNPKNSNSHNQPNQFSPNSNNYYSFQPNQGLSKYFQKTENPQIKLQATRPNESINLALDTNSQVEDLVEDSNYLGEAKAQIFGTLILAQRSDELILIDMHAAHERIVYEKLKQSYMEKDIVIQGLLIPLQLELSEDLISIFSEFSQYFKQIGFESKLEGSNLVITAVPQILKDFEIKALILGALANLGETETSDLIDDKIESCLSAMACYNAIRANEVLSIAEMNEMLRQMEQTLKIDQCNHGRPTWVSLKRDDLEQLFMRGK